MHDPDTLTGIASLVLAKDPRTYQALVMGLHVPQHRCRQSILDTLHIKPEDGAIRMTVELALLIEVHRPEDGYPA